MTISLAHRPPDRPEADGRDDVSRDDVLSPAGERTVAVDRSPVAVLPPAVDPPPPLVEASPPIIEDGVVIDARRHARRRRTRYGIAAAATSLALGAGAFMMFSGPSDIRSSTVEPERDGAAWPAPPADEAEVVAEWVRFHAGWSYVYEDGRVLWRPDLFRGIVEQRLSPQGVDLVRTGKIDPVSFVLDQGSIPAEAWSDPVPDEYSPTSYAICPVDTSGTGQLGPGADEIEARLPEAVRALVAGTSRSFTHGDWGGMPPPGGSTQTCFILAPGQTTAMWAHTSPDPNGPAGDAATPVSSPKFGTMTLTDGTTTLFWSLPILPHGVGGSWGG